MSKVGLILLAAGCAQRMGFSKQLLPLDGVPMLYRAVNSAISSSSYPIIVVTGANSELIDESINKLPITIVHNPDWNMGIGTSIKTGINAMSTLDVDATIITLSDQPLLSSATFDRLIESYQKSSCDIAASEYEGTLGTPALFDRSLFQTLLNLSPHEGCKKIIMCYPQDRVYKCSCPEAAIDIDTPSDYLLLLQKYTLELESTSK
ncbi:MAG: hypothetical protein RIR39_900 [Pseudomonadota bacterium]